MRQHKEATLNQIGPPAHQGAWIAAVPDWLPTPGLTLRQVCRYWGCSKNSARSFVKTLPVLRVIGEGRQRRYQFRVRDMPYKYLVTHRGDLESLLFPNPPAGGDSRPSAVPQTPPEELHVAA
jgi:hypothetical protein